MMDVMSKNFKIMFQILSERNITIISNICGDLKCAICKGILINATEINCKCSFCEKCIHDYIDQGGINCPGNQLHCNIDSLSNASINCELNNRISMLIVECSNDNCSYQSQLIDMNDHLKVCSENSSTCPFIYLGCNVINNGIDEHMLLAMHYHNKILIDQIGNLNNEVRELKEKINIINLEHEISKKMESKVDESIQSIRHDIDSVKMEIDDQREQFETTTDIVMNKLELMNNREIKIEVKEESAIEMKLDQNLNEKLSEEMEKVKILINESILEITSKMNVINSFIKIRNDGILRWKLGPICKISHGMSSDIFYHRLNPYKMGIILANNIDALNIWLLVHCGESDNNLKWPCQANITITISPLDNSINKYVKKEHRCKISKPKDASCEISNSINFSHLDLENSGLLNCDCWLIGEVKFQ